MSTYPAHPSIADVATRRVLVDARALAQVGASPVLAVDPGLIGRSISLPKKGPTESHAIVPLAALSRDDIRGNPEPTADGVGVVRITGPLCHRAEADLCGYVDGYDAILARFAAACRDDRAGAVVLVIDSPGGDVAGLEQMLAKAREIRDIHGKTVLVFVDELAASAAYWIASTLATPFADGGGIFLTEAGHVGSIGCIAALVDESKWLEQEGIGVELFRSPDGKAASHPAGVVRPLAEERIRASVEACAGRFYAAVATSRGLTAEAVAALNADVFEGATAKAVGLADGIKTLDQVLDRAGSAARAWRRARKQPAQTAQAPETSMLTAQAEATIAKLSILFAKHGVSDVDALDAKIDSQEALVATFKAEAAKVPAMQAKIDGLEAAQVAQAKERTDAEAAAKIAARRIPPFAKEKAAELYAKHGMAVLDDHLAAIPDMPNAAPRDAAEPAAPPTAGNPAALIGGAKTFAESTPVERHNFRAENGEEAYRAWKAAG